MAEDLPGEAERWRLTERLKKALEKRESPRFEMSVLVVLSGASGFLASVGLLHAGLHRIPVRYVAAVTIAYAVLLALLYVWIRRHRKSGRGGGATENGPGSVDLDPVIALDLGDVSTGSSGSTAGLFSGGGGRSGGGGASGSWTGAGGSGSGSSSGGGFDISVDGDDAGILIALAVAAVILLGASVWLVLAAPSLFAELLLDGALSAGLYRRLNTLPHRPWLETALKRTILPFLLAAITLGVVGSMMQAYAPEARSLGGVLAHRSNN